MKPNSQLKKSKLASKYKVLIGFNFGKDDTRKDKGEEVSLAELGEDVAKDLLSQNVIEAID